MKIIALLFIVIFLCSNLFAQNKGELNDAKEYFYHFANVRNNSDKINIKKYLDDSLKRYNISKVDSLISEYERINKLIIDQRIKKDIKSRYMGFSLFLSAYQKDFAIHNPEINKELIDKTGEKALSEYLKSISTTKRATMEKLWGAGVVGESGFYSTIETINNKRASGLSYIASGTPAEHISYTTEWWHKNLDQDISAQYGFIDITSTPTGGKVVLEGTTYYTNAKISVHIASDEKQTIVIKKEGYQDFSKEVKLENGHWVYINAVLRRN